MDAPFIQPFAPIFPVLSAVHTVGGHYVYLGEKAFRSLGVDTRPLIDRRWQDFAPIAEVDDEIEAVRQAVASQAPVTLARVRRQWSSVPVDLDVTIIPVRSRRGATLVMRRARVLEPINPASRETEASAPLMTDLQSLIGVDGPPWRIRVDGR